MFLELAPICSKQDCGQRYTIPVPIDLGCQPVRQRLTSDPAAAQCASPGPTNANRTATRCNVTPVTIPTKQATPSTSRRRRREAARPTRDLQRLERAR